jgi:hypothetical protein
LHQIIDELLDNAIKYSPDGGDIHLHVHDPDPNAGVVELIVTDTGLGIPASERELLFDRFHRGADTRHSDFKGAGLRLTLVRLLVEAHNGTITIDPDHQPGTRILVRLPTTPTITAAQPAGTAATTAPDRLTPVPGAAPGAGRVRRLLLAGGPRSLPDAELRTRPSRTSASGEPAT